MEKKIIDLNRIQLRFSNYYTRDLLVNDACAEPYIESIICSSQINSHVESLRLDLKTASMKRMPRIPS